MHFFSSWHSTLTKSKSDPLVLLIKYSVVILKEIKAHNIKVDVRITHNFHHANSIAPKVLRLSHVTFLRNPINFTVNFHIDVREVHIATVTDWNSVVGTLNAGFFHHLLQELLSVGIWHQEERGAGVDDDLAILSRNQFSIL